MVRTGRPTVRAKAVADSPSDPKPVSTSSVDIRASSNNRRAYVSGSLPTARARLWRRVEPGSPCIVLAPNDETFRSILSGDSQYDRYIEGDRAALSPEAIRGLQLFRGKANCIACHVTPTFTDERLHNTGIAWRAVVTAADSAR